MQFNNSQMTYLTFQNSKYVLQSQQKCNSILKYVNSLPYDFTICSLLSIKLRVFVADSECIGDMRTNFNDKIMMQQIVNIFDLRNRHEFLCVFGVFFRRIEAYLYELRSYRIVRYVKISIDNEFGRKDIYFELINDR